MTNKIEKCPYCGGPGVNVAAEFVTCGAAWEPDCAGHDVRTPVDADNCMVSTTWNRESLMRRHDETIRILKEWVGAT
jgi:hypothetical protein